MMKRLGSLVVLASVVAFVFSPVAASAAKGGNPGGGPPPPPPSGTFSCRASALRIEPDGLIGFLPTIEPFVANAAGDPCVNDGAGLQANADVHLDLGSYLGIPVLGVDLSLLAATTNGGMQGVAHSGVANLSINVLNTVAITASILTAEATAGPCPSTGLQSESAVLDVHASVAGLPVAVTAVDDHFEVDLSVLGLGVLTLHLNEKIVGANQITQRALWIHSDLIGDVIVAEAVADVHGDPCGSTVPKFKNGFMTGGGSIDSPAGRVTHGAHLMCVPSEGPNNLQVNWPGHRFHLESVTSSTCSNDRKIDPGKPAATFDTIEGDGFGRCDGTSGASVHWKLTDAGEPGRADRFEVTINGGSTCGLTAAGVLTGGNHQAHSKI